MGGKEEGRRREGGGKEEGRRREGGRIRGGKEGVVVQINTYKGGGK